MTYEICVLDPALAATQEAASAACGELTYWESSRPDHERDARKWQISDALLKFNPAMLRMDATAPAQRAGWLGKLQGEKREDRRYLAMSLPHGDVVTDFTVFDQAVEVEFAGGAGIDDARAIAQEAWRHLHALVALGFTTLFDTERKVLLDLNADFETVVRGYIANLKFTAEIHPPDLAAVRASRAGSGATTHPQSVASDQPFAGNVEEVKRKPWWKF